MNSSRTSKSSLVLAWSLHLLAWSSKRCSPHSVGLGGSLRLCIIRPHGIGEFRRSNLGSRLPAHLPYARKISQCVMQSVQQQLWWTWLLEKHQPWSADRWYPSQGPENTCAIVPERIQINNPQKAQEPAYENQGPLGVLPPGKGRRYVPAAKLILQRDPGKGYDVICWHSRC